MEAESKRRFTPCSICPPPEFKCPTAGQAAKAVASPSKNGSSSKMSSSPASPPRDPASTEAQLRRRALTRCLGLVSGGHQRSLLSSATALHSVLQGALGSGASECFVAGTTEHETRSIIGMCKERNPDRPLELVSGTSPQTHTPPPTTLPQQMRCSSSSLASRYSKGQAKDGRGGKERGGERGRELVVRPFRPRRTVRSSASSRPCTASAAC